MSTTITLIQYATQITRAHMELQPKNSLQGGGYTCGTYTEHTNSDWSVYLTSPGLGVPFPLGATHAT